jgi:phosphotransferase system  glucose/maltose/N-acetylglucosamine-specific IIC component
MSIVSLVPTIYNAVVGTVMATKGSSLAYFISATTIGNFSSSDSSYSQWNKYMNVIPDMVLMLVFITFYFYWLHKGEVITEEIRSEVQLKSYNVLELVEFSPKATTEDVERFMGQFGTVVEVAPVMNYN